MVSLSGVFAYFLVLAGLLVDEIIGFPKVRKASLVAEPLRNPLPKPLATLHAVVANVKSNNFPSLSADDGPKPPLLAFF